MGPGRFGKSGTPDNVIIKSIIWLGNACCIRKGGGEKSAQSAVAFCLEGRLLPPLLNFCQIQMPSTSPDYSPTPFQSMKLFGCNIFAFAIGFWNHGQNPTYIVKFDSQISKTLRLMRNSDL